MLYSIYLEWPYKGFYIKEFHLYFTYMVSQIKIMVK